MEFIPVRRYAVDADAFFAGVEQGEEGFVPRALAQRCAPAMNGLIARYGLAGKRVLSLGSGEAFEEFWFYKASCTLVLNDLDETGSFERYLQLLPSPGSARLDYVTSDAGALVEKLGGRESFDVLYVSSFHPDEMRREEMQQDFRARRSVVAKARFVTWPRGEAPYHDTLVSAAGCIGAGGLAIFQHYRGGVNVAANRHYLRDVARQFGEHGLTLLEVYCFCEAPAVVLVVAIKAGAADAQRHARELAGRPAIRSFHGRYPDDKRNNVVRAYSAAGGLRQRIAFWRWVLAYHARWAFRRAAGRTGL